MKSLIHFIKTSGIYFAGTVLMKLIAFLMMPIYTTYIDKGDMGTYTNAQAYITFLCSVLYLDIWSGIMRFMFEREGEERKIPINSGVAIFGISSLLYTVIIIVAGNVFTIPYLPYIYLYGLLMNVQTLFGYLARGYEKNILYASAGLLGSVVTILSNIVLIVFVHMDYSALFLSSCVGYICNIALVGWGIRIDRLISFRAFDRNLFMQLVRFSLPLSVNSVAYWFLASYNQIAITNILGNESTGDYSIALRFGSFVTLFTTCFNMAWQELSYSREAGVKDGQAEFYTKAVNAFIQFLGMGATILIPGIFIMFPFMVRGDYGTSKVLIPIYLLATIASAVSSFLGNIFTALKKNNILFYTTVMGSIVNVILVHLLLPRIGVQGASVALLSGFLLNILIRLIVLRKEIRIQIDWKFLSALLVLLSVIISVYFKCGLMWNILAGIVSGLLTLYVFRDMVFLILNRVLRKKRKEG